MFSIGILRGKNFLATNLPIYLHSNQAHEAVCEYVKVPCVHSECGELVTRAKLAEHLEQTCQYRMGTCDYCQAPVVFAAIKVSKN